MSFTAYVGLNGEARTVAEAIRKVKITLHKRAMLKLAAQFESNQAVNEAVLRQVKKAERYNSDLHGGGGALQQGIYDGVRAMTIATLSFQVS